MTFLFARLWTWIDDRLDITYRPERHFMRGPGPKTLRKHALMQRQADVDAARAAPAGA